MCARAHAPRARARRGDARCFLSRVQGWQKIKENGMDVLEAVLTGGTTEKQPFGNKGFVSLYTISYRMCSNAGSMDHSEALYERANRAINS